MDDSRVKRTYFTRYNKVFKVSLWTFGAFLIFDNLILKNDGCRAKRTKKCLASVASIWHIQGAFVS